MVAALVVVLVLIAVAIQGTVQVISDFATRATDTSYQLPALIGLAPTSGEPPSGVSRGGK